MTPIRILPLAAVLVLASAPLAAQGNVNGRVVDARGGAAVASARIVVDNGQLPGTEADVDGRFSLTLRAGEHVLRVDRLGYAAKEVRVTSPAAAEQVIALDPAPDRFTWWNAFGQAREKNLGWRIDYQVATPGIAAKAKRATIFNDVWFSDHAPVVIDYDFTL